MNKSRFIQASLGQKTDRPPIWMMRQAGRYLPEYQKIRKDHSFIEVMKTPALAAEVTIQPLRRFPMDAAILFSDILVIPEVWGLGLEFVQNHGPQFKNKIDNLDKINKVENRTFLKDIQFVFESIKLLRPQLDAMNTPLIGFAGGPITVASYILKGASDKGLNHTKSLIKTNPDLITATLEKLTEATILYLRGQIESGVAAIQLFDTWAGLLDETDFKEYVLPYVRTIFESLSDFPHIPKIYFAKGSQHYWDDLITLPINVLGVDNSMNLAEIRAKTPKNIALQGNLNPELLLSDQKTLKDAVSSILNTMAPHPGFIFNLGHGLLPKTPIENVELVVQMVQNAYENTAG